MIKIISSFCQPRYKLLLNVSCLNFASKSQKSQQIIDKFSQIFSQNNEITGITKTGRSWRSNQLRLKSSEDLHKLWYVIVRQKNILLADRMFLMKDKGQRLDHFKQRIKKLKLSMSRILGVINERQKIRKMYRERLEEQYILKKKQQLQKQIVQKQPLPQITMEMLKAKYKDLKKGVDNVRYLQKIYQKKQIQQGKRNRMQQRLQNSKPQDFKSFWQYEMNIGERPLQQEILRTHIKNWKSLNLKQRKIILGFLNARRSKDAKNSFIKQLKILGQKIAHDQAKQRIKSQQN